MQLTRTRNCPKVGRPPGAAMPRERRLRAAFSFLGLGRIMLVAGAGYLLIYQTCG